MFKNKNYLTPQILITIYNQTKTNTTYKNINTQNFVNYKNNKNTYLSNLTDFAKTQLIDICAVNYNKITIKNSIFYNYTWDLYINIINNNKMQETNSNKFNNSYWLEREAMEFFNIFYYNLKDTRHLLLNYNENVKYLNKTISVQPKYELKTKWHIRKIYKNINKNTEI